MAGRPVIAVAGLAVGCAGYLVIESRVTPAGRVMTGRTLTTVMVGRSVSPVAGLAIGCTGYLVVKAGRFPCGGIVTG